MKWLHNSKIRLEFKENCLKQDKVTFTPSNVIRLFIVYELDTWSRDLNADFALKDCSFGAIKLNKKADPDKYSYSGYYIGLGYCSLFSLPNFDWGKNTIIFGVDNSLSVHIDNKKKYILVLGDGQTQGLDDTTITGDAKFKNKKT